MNEYFIGAYWQERPKTLRQYADETREFLRQLQQLHPAFRQLEWVGDRPNSAIAVQPDRANLDGLIYAHAGAEDEDYDVCNPDGTPTWLSKSEDGFGMWYNNGKAASGGGMSIAIYGGQYGTYLPMPNNVVISFPEPTCDKFPYPEFYNPAFLKNLFMQMVQFWQPDEGIVTTHTFAEAMASDAIPRIGWLTYLRDRRAVALRNDASFESVSIEDHPAGGVLLSLGTTLILPPSGSQVQNARLLQTKLISEKILKL